MFVSTYELKATMLKRRKKNQKLKRLFLLLIDYSFLFFFASKYQQKKYCIYTRFRIALMNNAFVKLMTMSQLIDIRKFNLTCDNFKIINLFFFCYRHSIFISLISLYFLIFYFKWSRRFPFIKYYSSSLSFFRCYYHYQYDYIYVLK